MVLRSFTDTPKGSNSRETELSVVNCLTEMRFLIRDGETKILGRVKGCVGCGIYECPVQVIGIDEPSPTMMDEN